MYERIVVGVNTVDTAAEAARKALALGELTGAEVHLVCALSAPEGGARLSDMLGGATLAVGGTTATPPDDSQDRKHAEHFLDRLRRGVKVKTRTHLLPGDPAEVILLVAGEVDADLVVVGSRGMHGARRVLGSVPNSVSHKAECSVLIVRTV